jgi:hypothetical protein
LAQPSILMREAYFKVTNVAIVGNCPSGCDGCGPRQR